MPYIEKGYEYENCSNALHVLEVSGQERKKTFRTTSGRCIMGSSCLQEKGLLQSQLGREAVRQGQS